jgi:outer membrane immunogenic protein
MKAIILAGAALSLLTVSASAADLGLPVKAPISTPFTWTGCYAGANAGGGWGQKDLTDNTGFLQAEGGPASANLDIDGYMLGGQLGCDYQFPSNLVLGVEGYAAGGKIGGSTAVTAVEPGTFSDTTNFLTSGTARIGYAMGRWLPYIKGGAAWAFDNYSVVSADGGATYDETGIEDRFGWTVGGGIEWALWNDWSLKLEYDYYGLGTQSVMLTNGSVEMKQDIQTVLLGLNFHVFAGDRLAP